MGIPKRKNFEKAEEFKKDIANLLQKYYSDGYDDGVADTRDDMKAALSDGLRRGSSECGRQLRKYK